MNCFRCGSEMFASQTTIAFERNDTTYVFRHVPAKTCSKCGEEIISEEVHKTIEQLTARVIEPCMTINIFDMIKIVSQSTPPLIQEPS